MATQLTKNKKTMDFINKVVDKKVLNNLLSQIYLEMGGSKTAALANNLKDLGFKHATKAGTTISIKDLSVPDEKKALLDDANKQIEESTHRYMKGEITEVERYTKVIDTWSETTAKLTDSVVENFDRRNPVYMMAFSGARGNISQVSQLVGMRGLMADAQGQIIDLPITSNFKEGLSVTEYIISSYGARKGLVDTALKTADSGYLTRRLVDVAQDVIIRQADCSTVKSIRMSTIKDGEDVIVPLVARLLGRTIAEDIKDDKGNVLVAKNTTISREDLEKIKAIDLQEVDVRSALTCDLEYGICQKCYGWALTTQKIVDIGEAIGIIAAQSIGEPGTQLTMRTFHTGGVFRGAGVMRAIFAPADGTVKTKIATREFRTRHGDVVQIAIKEVDIKLETTKGQTEVIHIPQGATVLVQDGLEIKKGDKIAEFEPFSQSEGGRLTEKATKDITSDISGEVVFEDFVVDEKKDRQGNISRTSNKSGIVWVLGGDVYTLPAGSKVLVADGQKIKKGEKLAETLVVPEHGGEVRVGDALVIKETEFEGRTIKKIVSGKELTIVIASIQPTNAKFEHTKKEQIWNVDKTGDKFIVKCPIDTTVENGMIIAELIDEEHRVSSSGEIRYNGIEVDDNQVITKAGEVVFVPEEIHQISKDSSLKLVESGTYVEAGSEVVKDLYTHIDGIVEIKEFNDIIHEVIIRPGELHTLESINDLKVYEGEVIEAGTVVAGKIKAKVDSIVTIVEPEADSLELEEDLGDDITEDIADDEDILGKQSVQILIRPIQRFMIEPKSASIEFDTTDESIEIVPLTQLQYKDGARVRNLDGAILTRTSLVLSMSGHLSHLKGLVELDKSGELKIVVLENLIIRREQEDISKVLSSTQTELLVEDGQIIEPRTPVAKTQVLSVNNSIASIKHPEKELRRLLLISENYEEKIELKSKPSVKVGDFVRLDSVISVSGEKSSVSGKVVKADANSISVRSGRPHLISQGTLLQVDNSALILRGDLLATLIYEKQKTGDIVQGLPRVEELLEARKPKDSAIVAEDDGTVEIEYEEDQKSLYLVTDAGRMEIKVPIESSVIVQDKQKIKVGHPLTSGPLNPHDVIRLRGAAVAQQYLVDEVQRVYRSQGVDIADKHVEVIVRQMIKKVKVVDSGTTRLLPGELVELKEIETENAIVEKQEGGIKATYESILLGITKASLNTESFISAASFQETTRILTEAAVEGKKDLLRGLKENVIIGRLIPAGTGYYHLINSNEEKEKEAIKRANQKNQARKPSAILEEIEGMFGTPDFSIE
ncbi:DNA-directed RNA polymerase subunit beta' [Candidatus Gastranaerophilus sp. (ex Termes propinquus)]|nr:DNA-directed RNA polymerase subunit beta' [Candidatus Gastranaerophilus sp. (ex Termes propinquus)]